MIHGNNIWNNEGGTDLDVDLCRNVLGCRKRDLPILARTIKYRTYLS